MGAQALVRFELEPVALSTRSVDLRTSHAMAGDHLVPYVNTWLWPSFTLVGTSSLMFGIYIGQITNSHEWKEIFLDYCHHKRTTHSPNPLDKVARTVLNILKISPK